MNQIMNAGDIIAKLKKNKLCGRGGAAFPTGLKWKMVKSAKAKKKYIICNAAEGEPNVFKDGFILKNYPESISEYHTIQSEKNYSHPEKSILKKMFI